MAYTRSNCLCVLCFKPAYYISENDEEILSQFLYSFIRFLNIPDSELDKRGNLNDFVCCKKCIKECESFCGLYISWECLRLNLVDKANNFTNLIKTSDSDPSLVAVFKNHFEQECVGKLIQNLRNTFLKHFVSNLSNLVSNPILNGVKMYNFVDETKKEVSVPKRVEEDSSMELGGEEKEIDDNEHNFNYHNSLGATREVDDDDLVPYPSHSGIEEGENYPNDMELNSSVHQVQVVDIDREITLIEIDSDDTIEISDDDEIPDVYDELVDEMNTETNLNANDSSLEMDLITEQEATFAIQAVPVEINNQAEISIGSSQPQPPKSHKKTSVTLKKVTNSKDTTAYRRIPLNCPICHALLKFKTGLANHVKRIHKRILAHQCCLCDKKLQTEEGFKKHMYYIHGKKFDPEKTLTAKNLRYSLIDILMEDDEDRPMPILSPQSSPLRTQPDKNSPSILKGSGGNDVDGAESSNEDKRRHSSGQINLGTKARRASANQDCEVPKEVLETWTTQLNIRERHDVTENYECPIEGCHSTFASMFQLMGHFNTHEENVEDERELNSDGLGGSSPKPEDETMGESQPIPNPDGGILNGESSEASMISNETIPAADDGDVLVRINEGGEALTNENIATSLHPVENQTGTGSQSVFENDEDDGESTNEENSSPMKSHHIKSLN